MPQFGAASVATLLVCRLLVSQNPAPPPQQSDIPAAVLRIITRLVTVDVVVKDQSGAPVLDLNREDFTVLENGAPQEVKVFGLYQQPLNVDAQPEAPTLPDTLYTNVPAPMSIEGSPTVLLIDTLNTPISDQLRLRQQLGRLFRGRLPATNIAVYMLGSRLRMLQDFTTDPAVLEKAIAKLSVGPSVLSNEKSR
jgi:VWFA-related protein